jgi:hypothetical protein
MTLILPRCWRSIGARTGGCGAAAAMLRPGGREMKTTMNAVRRAMIRAVTGSPHVIVRR